MNVLDHYSIPYKGLGDGIHQLDFTVEDDFFKEFENPHIDNGVFQIEIDLDKRHDHSILDFFIEGYTKTNCDRCLEGIQLPIYGEYKLHVKFGEDKDPNEEIMFIPPETSILNLAQIIYEYICLSVPMIKAYECDEDEKPPCNFEVLDKMEIRESQNSDDNPKGVWDSLKGLNLDD